MAAEQNKLIRREIVGTINRYCHETRTPHADAWRAAYALLVSETGIDLGRPAKNKLDVVEQEGQLGTLARLLVPALQDRVDDPEAEADPQGV
jgi:hypothetical protein